MSYRSASSKTSEALITAVTAPGPNGYAESKYVAKHLVDYAFQKFGFLCSIARVGQVAGAVDHAEIWSPDEWFPSIIISSAHLCAILDSLGSAFSTTDRIPIDLLPGSSLRAGARATAFDASQCSTRIFHPINPQIVSWKALRGTVADELQSHIGKAIETISLRTWISRVRKDIESGAGSHASEKDLDTALRAISAAILLDFYEDLLTTGDGAPKQLDTTETMRSSQKLREMEGTKGDWMRKWIREWLVSRK